MQQFGHGAPSNYSYQYSNCTGKRKALLIGINYFRQKGELRGCINDVRNLSAFLMNKNRFRREDMVILTDDQSDPRSVPTRQNILRAMAWLVNGAEPNDSLFFHFSGTLVYSCAIIAPFFCFFPFNSYFLIGVILHSTTSGVDG